MHSAWKRLGALLVGTAAALLVSELVLRTLDPLGISYFAEQNRMASAKGPMLKLKSRFGDTAFETTRLKPGYRGWFGFDLQTNALGLRGGEVAMPKPAGTYRVLFLGDSVTFGQGVPLDQAFVTLVRQALQRRLAPRPVDIAIGAVPGWGGIDELLFLQDVGMSLEPDLVLLFYIPNDVPALPSADDESRRQAELGLLGHMFLEDHGLGGCYLFNFCKHLYWVRLERRGPGDFELLTRTRNFDQNPQAVELYRQILEHMVRLARQGGARFVVADTLGRPYMQQFARDMGLEYALILPNVDATPPQYRLSDVDAHPNATGHKFIADRLLEQLKFP
ncbi:MAG: SGNH/GDSL hydrolase family protein [Planctomycetota bacterium]